MKKIETRSRLNAVMMLAAAIILLLSNTAAAGEQTFEIIEISTCQPLLPCPPCDFNGDNITNKTDIYTVAQYLGTHDTCELSLYDINRDEEVNVLDLRKIVMCTEFIP